MLECIAVVFCVFFPISVQFGDVWYDRAELGGDRAEFIEWFCYFMEILLYMYRQYYREVWTSGQHYEFNGRAHNGLHGSDIKWFWFN